MRLAYDPAERHPWVTALTEWLPELPEGCDLAIHADDEMLDDALARSLGDRDAALVHYFWSAIDAVDTVQRLAQWGFGGLDQVARMLDFGSGYGRLTRFLVRHINPSRLCSAEVTPGALDFQRQRFGIEPLASCREPEELTSAHHFDLVWVVSLFTHLPEHSFVRWLERLLGLLAEKGILAFTVHDQELMPPHLEMPTNGLLYRAESESRSLDSRDYGSTWVTEDFIRRTIANIDTGLHFWRLPRGLCDYQDLYVVTARQEPVELDIDSGPRTQIERCTLNGPRELELSGWSLATTATAPLDRIEVRLGPEVVSECQEFGPRPEIGDHFRIDASRCSWQLHLSLPNNLSHGSTLVTVRARTRPGRWRLAYLGSLQRLLYLTARENYLRQREAVRQALERIDAMQNSRFWKLRNRWFEIKRALGLTLEP